MAIDATDWTIDRATGDIRYTGDDHGGRITDVCDGDRVPQVVAGFGGPTRVHLEMTSLRSPT